MRTNHSARFLGTICSVLSISVWFVCASFAASIEQKQGKAKIQVEAERIENGRPDIRLSDKITLTVSIEGAASLEVQPIEKVTTSPDWEISKKSNPQKTRVSGGRIRWQQTFALDPTKAGELILPVEPARYREDGGGWEEATWKTIPVHVRTEVIDADLHELRDATPPEQLPPVPAWRIPVAWAVLPLALAGLCLGLVYYCRYTRRQPALPPDQWALRELDRIGVMPLGSRAEIEQFHTLLSDVVRKYMELQFQLPAPEQTTAEFVTEMQQSPHLKPEQQVALRCLLEHCDLVKFARATPLPEESQRALATARILIQQCQDGAIAGTAPE